ncbi:MAG: PAS domain S-box protein [Candidatus Hodarchaeota archaeon]
MPQNDKSTPTNFKTDFPMFQEIAKESPLGIIVLQEGKILYANEKLAQLINYTLEEVWELTASDFLAFVEISDKKEADKRLKSALKGEVKPQLYQLRVKSKDAQIKWLQVLPQLITFEEKPTLLALVLDITDQKRVEQAYRDLVDNSLQGLLIIQDMQVKFANQAFASMSGYTIDELLNLSPQQVQDSVHPDYQARVWGRMRDRLEGKPVPSHYEFKAIRKDGINRWLEMYVTVIQFDERPAVQATIIDVTERKEADIRLQESQARYRELFDEVPIGLYRTAVDGQIIDGNPALIKLLGAKDKESLLSKNSADFYVNAQDRKRWKQLLAEESVITGQESQFKRLDGKIIWVRDSFQAIRDETGQIKYYEGSLEDITDRKKVEQALRDREKRYRALFDHTNDAVFIISLDLIHLEANQRAADMLGYTIEELIGIPVDQVVAEGEYEDSKRVLRALLAGEPVPVYERKFRKKTGEEFPVEINASLVTDAEGTPLHIQSAARDITERKQAEHALKESEARYRTLVETSPDAITLTDLEGKIIMANQQALQLYGAEDEKDLIGVSAFELIDSKDVPLAMENLQKTIREGHSGTLEYTLLRRDGTPYPAELNASVLTDVNGNPTAFIGVIRDISERKEAEARFRSLFDSVPVGLFRTTPDGTILDANPTLVQMLGFEQKEQLLQRKASSFYIDPTERKQWEAAVARQEVVTGVQAQFRREDGDIIWVELTARAIHDSDGNVDHYEGTLEDITDRKQAEQALKESEEKYRTLVDQSLQGHVIYQDGKIIFANPQMLDTIGLTQKEVLTMPTEALWENIHPADRERIQQQMQDRLAGKPVPERYELRLIRKDGTPVWMEVFVKLINYQGSPALQITSSDVTERKRAEQAIKESEEKYRNLVEQSLYGIVISQGIPPRIYFANEAFANITGYPVEELLAMSPKKVRNIIHPADQDVVISRIEERLAGKTVPQQYEYRVVRKDGTVRWVEIFANIIEYEGEPAIQSAYIDITERKEAEAALLESEERFRALVEELSDWVWEMDLQGHIIYSNTAVEDILGFSAGQVLGRTPCDFLRPEDVERAQLTWQELLHSRRPIRTLVIQFVHRDGSDVILEARGRPLVNEKNVLLGYRGICRDITDRLKMLEQLRALDERL